MISAFRSWLASSTTSSDAVDLAGTLRALGVPEKLLPRAEDRAVLTVADGKVTLEAKEVGFRFGGPRFVPAQVVRALVAALEGDRFSLSLQLGKEGLISIEGDRVTVKELESAWLVAIVRALTGTTRLRVEEEGQTPPSGIYALPREARFGVVIEDGALTITMKTATSHLTLGPARRGEPAPLEGQLGAVDVFCMNLAPPAVKATGTFDVTAIVRGPLESLAVTAFVQAPRLTVDRVVVTDVSAVLAATRTRLVWHHLFARGYEGRLTSEGVLDFPDAVSLTASLRDVDAGAIPIGDDRLLSMLATGRLAVDLRLTGKTGQGALRLEQATYPVLARGEAPLAKYGLRLPSQKASAPATCTITRTEEHGWTFGNVYAAVPGCVATGRLDVAHDGGLDGALTVALSKELLETSTMTSLLMERLDVPVRITGTTKAPVVDADLAATFGSFMTNNRVAAVFRSKESALPPAAPQIELASITPSPSDADAMRAWIRSGADLSRMPGGANRA